MGQTSGIHLLEILLGCPQNYLETPVSRYTMGYLNIDIPTFSYISPDEFTLLSRSEAVPFQQTLTVNAPTLPELSTISILTFSILTLALEIP